MRKLDAIFACLLWAAMALLLPMTALEPVAAVVRAPAPVAALASCEDGSVRLAMGCAGTVL